MLNSDFMIMEKCSLDNLVFVCLFLFLFVYDLISTLIHFVSSYLLNSDLMHKHMVGGCNCSVKKEKRGGCNIKLLSHFFDVPSLFSKDFVFIYLLIMY